MLYRISEFKVSDMKKIIKVYNKFEEIFLVVLIAAMVILLFAQVCLRFLANYSLSWSEELARILFIWSSWIGISLGQKKGEHIKITIITDRLKGNAKKAMLLFSDLCTLVILVVLCVNGVQVVEHVLSMGGVTPALGIPKFIMYGAVPLSCFLMAVRVIKDMWLNWTAKKEEVA